jgi:mannitol/fructose-specific phosphotransferase system IIA component
MSDQDDVRQWLDGPQNPELIERVEQIAEQNAATVVIDDEYIRRMFKQGETQDTSLAHACPLPHAGAD